MNTPACKLSAIVITKNEEKNIVECLRSVEWANEIIVVDAQSKDRTVELAKGFTPRVFVREWRGFGPAKNFALQQTTNKWVLWLDADERVTPELAEEIRRLVDNDLSACSAYAVARRAYFLGKWIKHCGWYPGFVVRLFKKDGVRFTDSRVHERLEFTGDAGRLRNDLLHFTDPDLYHYGSKFNRYTSLAAEELIGSGKEFGLFDVLARPAYLFLKMYVLRLGFLDGVHGLILSLCSSAYVFFKYAKLWELGYIKKQSTN